MFSFCCHLNLRYFNRSVINYALECLFRNGIPVRQYEMEAHKPKALILIQGCNVGVTCCGNAHCMLALNARSRCQGNCQVNKDGFKHMSTFQKINATTVQAFPMWLMEYEWRILKALPLELAE